MDTRRTAGAGDNWRSSSEVAHVATTLRTIPEVYSRTIAIDSFTYLRTMRRETPRRVLTLASEEQSETDQQETLFTQIASINEGLMSWHFALRDAQGAEIARVDKVFRGLGREASCIRWLPHLLF